MCLGSSEIQAAAKTRINSFKDKSVLQTFARRDEIGRDLLSLIEIVFDADKSDSSFWRSTIRVALKIDSTAISKTINYITQSLEKEHTCNNEEAHLLIDVLYSVSERHHFLLFINAEGLGPSKIDTHRQWSITTVIPTIDILYSP